MNASTRLAPVFALVVAGLTGCLGVDQPYPERRYFVIDAPRPAAATAIEASAQPALVVQRLRVSPAFEGRGLVYAKGDGAFEADYYNEFFISPGAMLTVELEDWLADTGLFAHVVDPSSQLDARLLLEGLVTKLYGDYTADGDAQAVLGLQVFLLDRDAPDAVLFHADYEERRPAPDGSPDALVAAWNDALGAILGRLEGDLANRDR